MQSTQSAHGNSVSDLETHLGYWLRFVSNHVSHSFQRKVEAKGVTVSEWVVLSELHRKGEISPGQLAVDVGMTKGAISKLLTRLESKALLTRAVDAIDKRNHAIHLTTQGRALVPVLAALADSNDEQFFGHLSQEAREAMQAALKEIVRIHQLKHIPID